VQNSAVFSLIFAIQGGEKGGSQWHATCSNHNWIRKIAIEGGKKVRKIVSIAAAVTMFAAQSFGLGFRNPDQGARATGQGEAFAAQADDASAIYYNPAGLTQLDGTHVTAGGYVSFPNIRFSGALGSDKMNTTAYVPHLYLASDFGLENWRFGLGVNVPFGNRVEYSETGPFRFLATESHLIVLNMAPTAAYQINENLSIGASLNVYHGDTKLVRFVSFFPFPLPDGRFQFDADGQAVGATIGLLWKIDEQHTIGVVYRSPFEIEFEGTARLDSALGEPPANARADIQFPQSVTVGYAFRPTKKLKLEVDVEWTNWDMLNDVVLRAPGASFDGDTIPFHWKDSFFYEFGAEYELNDHWVVRAGYIFSENSVPTSTFSPLLPDSDRHIFSVGGGFSNERVRVDAAYQYSLSENRTVSGSVNSPDGKWKSDAHTFIVTGTVRF
jgi:long-chain fatty acid transport protein